MNPGTIIARFWNWIPSGLKKFVGIGIACGIALTLVLAAWLFWGTGYIQEKLNIPTRADVAAAKESVAVKSEAELQQAIAATALEVVGVAMRQAEAENDSLFQTMVRDVIEPGIAKQNRLYKQVERLSKLMGDNNSLLVEQTERTTSSIEQLRDQVINKDDGRQLMSEILEEMQRNRERDKAIMKKLKINIQEF